MHTQIITQMVPLIVLVLVDLAIDNAYILERCIHEKTGLSRQTNLIFHKKLATELLSMHSLRSHSGRQAQNVPARLVQQHFQPN